MCDRIYRNCSPRLLGTKNEQNMNDIEIKTPTDTSDCSSKASSAREGLRGNG